MPKQAKRKARRRGGIARYRMMKKGGRLWRCMITRKAGPRGGRTICYRVRKRKRKKGRR